MTERMLTVLRPLPGILFAYGIAMTIMGVLEANVLASDSAVYGTTLNPQRVLYLTAILRACDPFFFHTAMAGLVLAAIRYLDMRPAGETE